MAREKQTIRAKYTSIVTLAKYVSNESCTSEKQSGLHRAYTSVQFERKLPYFILLSI